MRRLLTLIFCVALTTGLIAQTVFLEEDFETGALPAGWTQATNANDGGWKFGDGATLGSQFWALASNGTTVAATNDDACNCDKSADYLITPPVDFSNATTISMGFDKFFGGFTYAGSTEAGFIEASTDGGMTWQVVEQISGFGNAWTRDFYDISSLAGMSNVMLAIRYQDDGGWMFGFGIDNILIFEPPKYNLDLAFVNTKAAGLAGTNGTVSAGINNFGSETITSLNFAWSDGTSDYSENISGLNIAPFTGVIVEHPTSFTFVDGVTNFDVNIASPNDSTDIDPSNNTGTSSSEGFQPSPGKKVVAEEATGTWCTWCPRGQVFMDSMTHTYPEFFIPIAVHNNDPMVVPTYDAGIRAFPGFPGFPSVIVDRQRIIDPSDLELNTLRRSEETIPAELSHSASVDNGAITITVDANFIQNVSGAYRLNAIISEDGVTGTGSGYAQVNAYSGGGFGPMGGFENLPSPVPASMMVYNHVARAIMAGWAGDASTLPSAIMSGESYSHTFPAYTVAPDEDINNMYVITMLTNPAGQIVSAEMTTVEEATTSISEKFDHSVAKVFPNPFNDVTNVSLELSESVNVSMTVFNAFGQQVANRDYGKLSGKQILPFDGRNFPEGIYYIHLRIDDKLATKTVTLTK